MWDTQRKPAAAQPGMPFLHPGLDHSTNLKFRHAKNRLKTLLCCSSSLDSLPTQTGTFCIALSSCSMAYVQTSSFLDYQVSLGFLPLLWTVSPYQTYCGFLLLYSTFWGTLCGHKTVLRFSSSWTPWKKARPSPTRDLWLTN